MQKQIWESNCLLLSYIVTKYAKLLTVLLFQPFCFWKFSSFPKCIIYVNLNRLIRRRQWQPTPVLLPGKSHGWRSLVGCSPWGHEESDTYWATSLSRSCIGEGNGNPLQCSCLEDPRDGGAWWAAIYGVAQSRTRLKWLSSSKDRIWDYSLIRITWVMYYSRIVGKKAPSEISGPGCWPLKLCLFETECEQERSKNTHINASLLNHASKSSVFYI